MPQTNGIPVINVAHEVKAKAYSLKSKVNRIHSFWTPMAIMIENNEKAATTPQPNRLP